MIKLRISILTLMLAVSSCFILKAQVTIGVDAYPSKGAILDLKTENNQTGGMNSDKGLMMPRVVLQNMESLFPLLTVGEEAESGIKARHTGLLVYNVDDAGYFCKDVYTWDGNVWQPNEEPSVLKVDAESNSFIISPSARAIDIPVKKAYNFWLKYRSPKYLKNGFNTTAAGADKSVDLNTLVNGSGSTIEAEVVWMDEPKLITNTAKGSNTLIATGNSKGKLTAVFDNGTPNDISDDYIRVYTSCTSSKQGNAVVALKINNEVVWSWHLWITDYDPNTAVATDVGKTSVENGSIYRYNNTSVPDGNYVFMDRNLGSTTQQLAEKRGGLYYQWGRKDPFPSFKYLNNTDRKIYNGVGIVATQAMQNVSAANNLATSIKTPNVFYIGTSNSLDWFTSASYTNAFTDRLTVMNDFLWNDGGLKTELDPCPKGWKVPEVLNADSPWFLTRAGGGKLPSDYTSQAFDKGFKFEDVAKGNVMGNYPATGYICSINKVQMNVSSSGRVWTSSAANSGIGVSTFEFSKTEINPWAVARRSHGYAVRCVQETKK